MNLNPFSNYLFGTNNHSKNHNFDTTPVCLQSTPPLTLAEKSQLGILNHPLTKFVRAVFILELGLKRNAKENQSGTYSAYYYKICPLLATLKPIQSFHLVLF